jgi:hypothetical protein
MVKRVGLPSLALLVATLSARAALERTMSMPLSSSSRPAALKPALVRGSPPARRRGLVAMVKA